MVSVGSSYRANWRTFQASAPFYLSIPMQSLPLQAVFGSYATGTLTYDGPHDKTNIIVGMAKNLTIDQLETLMYQLDVLLGSL